VGAGGWVGAATILGRGASTGVGFAGARDAGAGVSGAEAAGAGD
jgi:hypothetical protein